jgi:hypothetical protein
VNGKNVRTANDEWDALVAEDRDFLFYQSRGPRGGGIYDGTVWVSEAGAESLTGLLAALP